MNGPVGKPPAFCLSNLCPLLSLTQVESTSSPSQHATLNRLRPLEREQAMKRGRATVASMRQCYNEGGHRNKLNVPWPLKKSDSSTSLPSDRSSSASLPSPDISETSAPRVPTPERLAKSPHKDRDVTNLLRETYKGPSQRNSTGSRPNSSSSVASSSSTSSRESASTSEESGIPPALPERRPSQPVETSIPRTVILEPARPLPHELPENGDTSPPPLPKKTSVGGSAPPHASRRRHGYDQAPPAVPVKANRSHSLGGDADSPRPSSGEVEEAPPPIPSRPEKRSVTNPPHLDTIPLSPSPQPLDPIPGSPPAPTVSPPPPNIPPPELPESIVASQVAEKLAGELKKEASPKPKVPPPVPLRPKSRKGSLLPSPESGEV